MQNEWTTYIKKQVKVTPIRSKLLRARFNQDGDIKPGRNRDYVYRHFPNLLKAFKEGGMDDTSES